MFSEENEGVFRSETAPKVPEHLERCPEPIREPKPRGSRSRETKIAIVLPESPKDFQNIEIPEESVRLDARQESTVGPSSCSSSPTNSPARHSQHYRTLQSYSSPTRKLNIAVTPNHQRDVDQVHSKRWHTAPKEKHKVHISCTI